MTCDAGVGLKLGREGENAFFVSVARHFSSWDSYSL